MSHADPEVRREYKKKWRAVNATRINERNKKWREANADHNRGRIKGWREANADHISKYNKDWNLDNPDARKAIRQTRRARKRGAEGKFTLDDVHGLFTSQGALCICGVDLNDEAFHVDHKTPLSRGGSNWPSNLQLLCVYCNGSKGTRINDEWLGGHAV